MHINLLPASTRLLIQFDQQLRVYLKLWMFMGTLATVYLTYQLMLGRAAQTQLAKLDFDCEPVHQLQEKIQSQRQLLTVLQKRKATLTSLHSTTHPVAILGSVVQSIAAQSGKVRLQRLSVQQDQDNVSPTAVAPAISSTTVSKRQSIVLVGEAADDASLSQLIRDMQRVGTMDKVELKSTSRTANMQTRQFHIEAWQRLPTQPAILQPSQLQ